MLCFLHECSHGDRSRAFDDPASERTHFSYRIKNLSLGDEHRTVDHAGTDIQRYRPRLQATSGTFRERGLFGKIQDTSSLDRFQQYARILWPASHDFRGW